MNIKKTIVASLLACMLPAVVMAKRRLYWRLHGAV